MAEFSVIVVTVASTIVILALIWCSDKFRVKVSVPDAIEVEIDASKNGKSTEENS